MAISYKDMEREFLKSIQPDQSQYEQNRKQYATDYESKMNAAIDQSAQTVLNNLESEKQSLPSQYKKQYDINAVQELVNRRQLGETMARMGLTDSGLNRTQQTALTLQRGNADASVRAAEQEAARKLQQAIDEAIANREAQKLQNSASIWGQANTDILNNLTALQNSARQNAASQYNAELEAEQAAAKLAAEQAQAQEAARVKAAERLTANQKWVYEYNAKLESEAAAGTDLSRKYLALDEYGNIVPAYTLGGNNYGTQTGGGSASGTQSSRPQDYVYNNAKPEDMQKPNYDSFITEVASYLKSGSIDEKQAINGIISHVYDAYGADDRGIVHPKNFAEIGEAIQYGVQALGLQDAAMALSARQKLDPSRPYYPYYD